MQWSNEYWDATLDRGRAPRESEPIDDVIDWIKREGYNGFAYEPGCKAPKSER